MQTGEGCVRYERMANIQRYGHRGGPEGVRTTVFLFLGDKLVTAPVLSQPEGRDRWALNDPLL